MEIRRSRVAGSIRTEGGLLPSDLLEKIRAGDPDIPGLKDADFALSAGERVREATTRSWNRLVGSWAALGAVRVGAGANDPLVGPTRDRFLVPLFEELGFGRLPVARAVEIEGTNYPISHSWEARVPVHLVGYGVELDSRTKGVRGAAGAAPHALVQDYLNRADDALWGVVSNGRTLRLLRDSSSLTRQAYVEFDLEAIFEGELYADFALLWSVLHRSRFEGEKPADCLLERWTKKAADDGTRALDKLRGGVEKAIETLGAGFLATKGNAALVEALRRGTLDSQDYYRELLRLVYRLIFLFAVEDRRDEESGRELLLDPAAPEEAAERYRRYYSTVRLRSFASRRRGSRHPDLWVGLRRVVAALGADGAPSLALPALGSFLFGSEACPHLDASDLTNEALLDAVRALATIEEDRRLRLVDYRNLGAEELGGIYEGLLELHPRIELDATPPRFSLGTAAGNERKSTGSYYTPTSLINCLLDSALDPVVDEAVTGKSGSDAEAAILGLAVVDPAAGSGHFLIAAAHRLAKRLAAVRSGEGEPPPAQIRHALRDVIARCIHAVDINPMAVELCKVSLWLEALEPGKPLSFLDAHIKCGNSLLGTTQELASAGVPDSAFEPISGDVKAVAQDWRRINAGERAGQYSLFGAGPSDPVELLAAQARTLEAMPEDSPASVAAKAARHDAYRASDALVCAKSALDAWCAAFVIPKEHGAPAVTTATVRSLAGGGRGVYAATRELVERAASEYKFFQWSLEFPAVFERGGFDVVLGNPPWEALLFREQEFFAETRPDIAQAATGAIRERLVRRLVDEDPALHSAFQQAQRTAEAVRQFVQTSGRYPLTGRGRTNTFALFGELGVRLSRGRTGQVLPTGVATDDSAKLFFQYLVDESRLLSLYDFENRAQLFPAVDSRARFSLVTTGQHQGVARPATFAFLLHDVSELDDESRLVRMSSEDIALVSPNTRTAPTFGSATDAAIVFAAYRRYPILLDEGRRDGGPWHVQTRPGLFNMTGDSALFRSSADLEATGFKREGYAYVRRAERFVPLLEGKMFDFFDHRAARVVLSKTAAIRQGQSEDLTDLEHEDPATEAEPRYWVSDSEVRRRAGSWNRSWLVGWKEVTSATNERTMIAATLPLAGVGHKIPIVLPDEESASRAFLLGANLASMVVDFIVRQRLSGTSLTPFTVKQLPVLPPEAYDQPARWEPQATLGDWLSRRVVELTVTTVSMESLGADGGWVGPPFRWDPMRRTILRAELDAAFLHLYGLARGEVEHILNSFSIVRRRDESAFGTYRTRDLILAAYDEMEAAAPDCPFVSRLDPPPGDPRVAHPPRPGDDPGHWIPWLEVVARAPQSSPAARPVHIPAPLRAKPSATDPTRAIPEPRPSLFATDPASAWQPEATVAPSEIVMGARVRHRARGVGTVLSVRPAGKSTELLIRFDATGETWIVFGYGVLEFQQ